MISEYQRDQRQKALFFFPEITASAFKNILTQISQIDADKRNEFLNLLALISEYQRDQRQKVLFFFPEITASAFKNISPQISPLLNIGRFHPSTITRLSYGAGGASRWTLKGSASA